MNKLRGAACVMGGLAIIGLFTCLCLGILTLTGGLALFQRTRPVSSGPSTPHLAQQTTPLITPELTRPAPEPAGTQTLTTLRQAEVPIEDAIDLARRLKGSLTIETTVPAPKTIHKVGERAAFWVTDTHTNQSQQVWATLDYIGLHLYFWIADGITYAQDDVKKLSDTFDLKIYPTDREFFGSEWIPGVDDDPRLYVLYCRGLGTEIAGYFSSVDELPLAVHSYSNAHEMFKINADTTSLAKAYIYGTMAHEFQHMIHWNQDRNEEGWMNEGFSMLAQMINGYEIGGFDWIYLQNPNVQLNDWAPRPQRNTAHYGASFLFLAYFLDRFGEDATRALVADPANGLQSLDDVLARMNFKDPQTGRAVTADDVFADWVVTNYVQDAGVGDGRYQYHDYSQVPKAAVTEAISQCPLAPSKREMHQYAVNTLRITCPGRHTLDFNGSTSVKLVPADPYSGNFAFWSNKGDESDMTLTRPFDFSQVQGPIDLRYQVWYDLENDYDYAYVEASLDGQSWQILTSSTCTTQDTTGNNFGCGYNGQSPGWVSESVDLSAFAGKQFWLRFEYLTDSMVNGEGLLLDDISIPQAGYFTDFEQDDGGWQAQGFVRVQNQLPQTFRLSLILKGQTTVVQAIELSPDQIASIPITIGEDIKEVVLVASGTSRFTRQDAFYQISIH